MNEIEARKFINDFVKKANPEQLKSIICGCFSPLCSHDCPLRKLDDYNCSEVIQIKTTEENIENKQKEVDKKEVDKKEVDKKEVDKKEVDKKEVDKKDKKLLKTTLLLF